MEVWEPVQRSVESHLLPVAFGVTTLLYDRVVVVGTFELAAVHQEVNELTVVRIMLYSIVAFRMVQANQLPG